MRNANVSSNRTIKNHSHQQELQQRQYMCMLACYGQAACRKTVCRCNSRLFRDPLSPATIIDVSSLWVKFFCRFLYSLVRFNYLLQHINVLTVVVRETIMNVDCNNAQIISHKDCCTVSAFVCPADRPTDSIGSWKYAYIVGSIDTTKLVVD